MIHQVGKNAIFNILGVGLPAIVGILTVPVLLNNLGAERLGIFTLALGLIGFSGVFDLGLGRALTQSVATATGLEHSKGAIAHLVRRTLPLVLALGLTWGGTLALFSDSISNNIFNLDKEIATEAINGILWLGLAIPLMLLSGSLAGVLEGLQLFFRVNLLRIPVGVLTFLLPSLGSYFTSSIDKIIALLVLLRLAALAVWFWQVNSVLPLWSGVPKNQKDTIKTRNMWHFTGWLTVTNIIGPLMVYADRFYLASIFPPATVAYYTVPQDTLFRATAFPVAALNALFPALAQIGTKSMDSARLIYRAAVMMLLIWAIPLFVASFMLETLLRIWIGNDFAAQGLGIAQWLLLGVMVNGFAHIPYALLQSAGRADLTAKIHVLEFPIYAAMVIFFINIFGILGAALAWSCRIIIDTGLLYIMAIKLFKMQSYEILIGLLSVIVMILLFLFVSMEIQWN